MRPLVPLLSVLACAGTATLVPAESPDPTSLTISAEQRAKARALVQQLGSDSYLQREQANRELRKMGRLALPVLTEMIAVEQDPEIRFRCELLLPQAEAEDLKARIEVFLADEEGRYHHDLPGWTKYRTIVGTDRSSRALFAELLKHRDFHDLLLASEKTPAELGRAIVARRELIQQRMNPSFPIPGEVRPTLPSLPEIALLLFCESLVSEKDAPFVTPQFHLSNFLYQPAGREAASGSGPFGTSFRRLTLHWLDTRDGIHGINTAMSVAQNLNLGAAEVTKHAARMLTTPDAAAWNRSNAACLIAAYKGREQLPALVKLFADDTILIRANNQLPDIQLRDVALAMAVLLTDQDPNAYGFEVANANPQARYNPTTFRFRDDKDHTAEDKRQAAFKKWADWYAKQPR